MRTTGQVGSGGPLTAHTIPVPTQALQRPENGIQERSEARYAARAARTLRPLDPATPDRWTNPSQPATTQTLATVKARRVPVITHGSAGGAQRHRRDGTQPCELCLARARQDRQRSRLNLRKASQ